MYHRLYQKWLQFPCFTLGCGSTWQHFVKILLVSSVFCGFCGTKFCKMWRVQNKLVHEKVATDTLLDNKFFLKHLSLEGVVNLPNCFKILTIGNITIYCRMCSLERTLTVNCKSDKVVRNYNLLQEHTNIWQITLLQEQTQLQ